MYFSYVVALAAVFTATEACLHCPHPGNFVGFVTTYIHPNPNYCQTDVNDTAIVVSVPASYFDPFDESPCGGTVNITNTCTGKIVLATVVGNCTACANNDILLTKPGLAALAPDRNPENAPFVVLWTFNS